MRTFRNKLEFGIWLDEVLHTDNKNPVYENNICLFRGKTIPYGNIEERRKLRDIIYNELSNHLYGVLFHTILTGIVLAYDTDMFDLLHDIKMEIASVNKVTDKNILFVFLSMEKEYLKLHILYIGEDIQTDLKFDYLLIERECKIYEFIGETNVIYRE